MFASPRAARFRLGLVVMTLVCGLAAAGCSATGSTGSTGAATGASGPDGTVSRRNKDLVESSDRPTPGGKLVYALTTETNGWNPATNQWAPSGLIVSQAIFDTLTAYDEKSQIKPFLAQSFTPNADFSEWTFVLRPGITFHNGKPVTAQAVVRDQLYLSKSPVTGPAYTYAGVTAVTAKDDLTFTVTLNRPSAVFPITFATQLGVVADPDWLESNDGLHPIGTGPFSMDSWEIGHKLTVKKNPNYWRVDANGIRMPYLDTVEFQTMPDNASRQKALMAADVDVIQTFAGQQVVDLQKVDGMQVFSDATGESRDNMVMLNTMVAPFDDPDARLALAYATDTKSYSDIVTGGFNEVATGPIGQTSPWYAPSNYPTYDAAKARELVEKVKARHGGTFSFTLSGIAEPENQEGVQVLLQQWAAVGIDAKVDLQEGAKLVITTVTGGYQATMWGQFDAPNPFADGVWWDAELAVPPPAFTLNFARNKDQVIHDALSRGGQTDDFAQQKAAMAIVQQRLGIDVPYIWLNHLHESLIANRRVVNLINWTLPDGSQGLDLNQGGHPLTQVWLHA